MAQTMKIRKGDTVQVTQARTAASRAASSRRLPKHGRVLVENINMIKRHQRPRPIQNSSRMGGPQIIPGGDHREVGADSGLERDGRLPDVQEADARRHASCSTVKDKKIRVRVCKNHDCGQEIDKSWPRPRPTPRAEGALRARDPACAQGRARTDSVMQVPRIRRSRSTWAWARRRPTRSSSTPPSRS